MAIVNLKYTDPIPPSLQCVVGQVTVPFNTSDSFENVIYDTFKKFVRNVNTNLTDVQSTRCQNNTRYTWIETP